MNVNRDVLDRLERLELRYYVTGSWALAAYAEPRMTRDLDLVLDLAPDRYEAVIRPAFDDVYLVNDLIRSGDRAYGGVIHRSEIEKVDLMLGRDDPWSRSAMDRRRALDHAGLGSTFVISPEDLLLAKLDWSDGGASELQLRDCRSIIRLAGDLDWPYIERYAAILGVAPLLEQIRAG